MNDQQLKTVRNLLEEDATHEGEAHDAQEDAQDVNVQLVQTSVVTFGNEEEPHAVGSGVEESQNLVELGDSGAVHDDAVTENCLQPSTSGSAAAPAAEQVLVQQLEIKLVTPLADQRTEAQEHALVNENAHRTPDAVHDAQSPPAPEPAPAPATPSENVQHQPVAAKSTSPVKEKSPSPTASGDVCCVCGKKVYPLEKLVAEKRVFHKTCFRCKKCNRTLNSSNYATLNNDYYCKPHQLELFRLQGRYEVTDTPAEVVNRSPVQSPINEAAASVTESGAEELRRARAMFEKNADQPATTHAVGGAQVDLTPAQYGGVGALKSRYLASASQNANSGDAGRPPPRKMTPPRHDTSGLKANGNGNGNGYGDDTSSTGHGEFENEPLRIEGVVRESDRAQFEAELPKQGSAKNAFAMFRNLESSNKATSVSVSASQDTLLNDSSSSKVDNSEAS